MTEDARKGRLPTPEEFFDTSVFLADLTKQSLLDSEALRDEVRRLLSTVEKSHTEMMTKLDKQAEDLKASYAPQVVEQTVNACQSLINKLTTGTNSFLTKVTKLADQVAKGVLIRNALWSGMFGMLLGLGLWLAMQGVPSLDEIRSRRSEVQALSSNIDTLLARKGQLDSDVENLKGRLVFAKGQWYVRIEPGDKQVDMCADPSRKDTCVGPYVPVR